MKYRMHEPVTELYADLLASEQAYLANRVERCTQPFCWHLKVFHWPHPAMWDSRGACCQIPECSCRGYRGAREDLDTMPDYEDDNQGQELPAEPGERVEQKCLDTQSAREGLTWEEWKAHSEAQLCQGEWHNGAWCRTCAEVPEGTIMTIPKPPRHEVSHG